MALMLKNSFYPILWKILKIQVEIDRFNVETNMIHYEEQNNYKGVVIPLHTGDKTNRAGRLLAIIG